jgi:hypothetical protein
LLTAWATKRRTDEGLSDFYQRHIQRDAPRHLITGKEDPTRELVQLEIAS